MTKKILCIEDEQFIAELYGRALKKAGYEVTIEEDGRKGLTLGQSGQYDIVLLDLMLPSLSGLNILKTLRNQKLSPAFRGKIVITTNLAERKSTQMEIEKQADGYLIKAAITPRQLVEFLSRIDTTNTHPSPTA